MKFREVNYFERAVVILCAMFVAVIAIISIVAYGSQAFAKGSYSETDYNITGEKTFE